MLDQNKLAELIVGKSEQELLIKHIVEKQGRESLVPKKVQITRSGKTFEQTVFVRPFEDTSSGKLKQVPKGSVIEIKPGTKAPLSYKEGIKTINGGLWRVDDVVDGMLNISTLEEGKNCSWIKPSDVMRVRYGPDR